MYIEICQDVVDDAIAKSGQKVNDSLDLLQLFALFSFKGKHIIVVPSLRNNKELITKLSQVMTSVNVEKLRRNEKISYLLPSIKAAVSVYCLVTYIDNNQGDPRAIVINPSRYIKFEPYLETILVTENILDSKFFKYIARFYARQQLLKGIQMRYEVKPGGGSTTSDVVREEVEKARRFCLVIVDSDKKYPEESKVGDTAQKIIEVMENYPCQTCKLYVFEKVMEVENLIPKRIVKEYASEKSSCNILEKDFSFYDMKVGICLKGLYSDDVFHYWQPLLQEEGLDCSGRDEAKNHSTNRTSYERYVDDHNLNNEVKKGFGSDLLRVVTCSPDKKGMVKYPELEEEMLNKITPNDLTASQIVEWTSIGKHLFSWACGLTASSI